MDDYFFTTHGCEIKILIFTKGVRGHLFRMRFAAKRRAVVLSNNTHEIIQTTIKSNLYSMGNLFFNGKYRDNMGWITIGDTKSDSPRWPRSWDEQRRLS